MLHTPLCDLLAIDVPIIQAGMGPWSPAGLAAAVSNAGGLGTIGASTRPALDDLRTDLHAIRTLTDRPFAINHNAVVADIDPEAFELTLAARPALISFALSPPGDLIERAHGAGSLVMAQVTTVAQARHVAAQGVDIVCAQGGEAGGFGGTVGTLPLIPQVVDAVRPLPVVAAGGVADGRGIAAALCLGAQAVNLGTRFLAATEAPVDWQERILAAESEDTVKIAPWRSGAFGTVPRALPTPFIDGWQDGDRAAELRAAAQYGRLGELTPFTGQSAGLIRDIIPAAEIVSALAAEAEAVLNRLT